MKLKEENKKEIKKNIITGVSTATGAVLGSVIENTFNPVKANAHESGEPEMIEAIPEDEVPVYEAMTTETNTAEISGNLEVAAAEAMEETFHATPDYISCPLEVVTTHQPPEEGYVEVVGYSTETDPTIFQTDTDIIMNPTDDNEIIVSNPVEVFVGEETANHSEIEQPIADTDITDTRVTPLGNETLTASELDMPDYVNNANIDSFMEMV